MLPAYDYFFLVLKHKTRLYDFFPVLVTQDTFNSVQNQFNAVQSDKKKDLTCAETNIGGDT